MLPERAQMGKILIVFALFGFELWTNILHMGSRNDLAKPVNSKVPAPVIFRHAAFNITPDASLVVLSK